MQSDIILAERTAVRVFSFLSKLFVFTVESHVCFEIMFNLNRSSDSSASLYSLYLFFCIVLASTDYWQEEQSKLAIPCGRQHDESKIFPFFAEFLFCEQRAHVYYVLFIRIGFGVIDCQYLSPFFDFLARNCSLIKLCNGSNVSALRQVPINAICIFISLLNFCCHFKAMPDMSIECIDLSF